MKDLAIILGIRPDVIRASKILNLLAESSEITYDLYGRDSIIQTT